MHFLEDGAGNLRIEASAPVPPQRDVRKEIERFAHRQRDDVADALVRHEHRQALGLETPATARRARLLHHILLELLADGVGRGFPIPLFDVVEHTLPAGLAGAVPALAVLLVGDGFAWSVFEQDTPRSRLQVAT